MGSVRGESVTYGFSVALVTDEDATAGELVISTLMPIVASVSGSSVATEASVIMGSPELGSDSVVEVVSKLDETSGATDESVTSDASLSGVASVTNDEIVMPGDSVSKPSVATEASVITEESNVSAPVVTPSVAKEISIPSGLVVTETSVDAVSDSSVTVDGIVLDGVKSVSGATVLIVEILSVTGFTVLVLVTLAVSVAEAPIGEMVVDTKLSGTSAAIEKLTSI